jgi:hypothetical protein
MLPVSVRFAMLVVLDTAFDVRDNDYAVTFWKFSVDCICLT